MGILLKHGEKTMKPDMDDVAPKKKLKFRDSHAFLEIFPCPRCSGLFKYRLEWRGRDNLWRHATSAHSYHSSDAARKGAKLYLKGIE